MEKRNVGTRGKNPTQDLTSANDLTIGSPRDASPPTTDWTN